MPDAFSANDDLFFNSSTGAEADPGIGSSNPSRRQHVPTQEQIEQVARERGLAHIDIAVGGSSSGLHRETSNVRGVGAANEDPYSSKSSQSSQPMAGFDQVPTRGFSPTDGHGNDESYELREIDTKGVPIASPATQAPALRHPGYGRNSQHFSPDTPMPPYGGLTETDSSER